MAVSRFRHVSRCVACTPLPENSVPMGRSLGEPKTARSSRSLDLPTFTTDALKDLQETSLSPSKGPWKGLVFCTDTGLPLDPANVRRALRTACKTAGVPLLTPYDLRRTAGSLLVDAGVHLEQVLICWAFKVATTRRHYVRLRHNPTHNNSKKQSIFDLA